MVKPFKSSHALSSAPAGPIPSDVNVRAVNAKPPIIKMIHSFAMRLIPKEYIIAAQVNPRTVAASFVFQSDDVIFDEIAPEPLL